jgi:hypothetical protein
MFKVLMKRGCFLGLTAQRFAFSGGHHHKPYDWRDDHALNPFYEADPKSLGIPNSYEYGQPFHSEVEKTMIVFPDNYNPKDLTVNFAGGPPLLSVA